MSQTVINQEMDLAYGGMLVDSAYHMIESRNQAEVSASIGFGWCVKQGTGDRDAILPTGNTDVVMGIVVHSHAYAKAGASIVQVDTVGVTPKSQMNILRRGRIWVFGDPTGSAITPGARLFYDFTTKRFFSASGGGRIDLSAIGAFRTSCTVAGAVVQVEVDFVNKQ